MRHLKEQELIAYEFGLGSGRLAGKVERHLEKCERCRMELEALRRKFASLDLLKEDVEVDEKIIQKAVAVSGKKLHKRPVILKWGSWTGVAAWPSSRRAACSSDSEAVTTAPRTPKATTQRTRRTLRAKRSSTIPRRR